MYTDEQKAQALANARKSLAGRREWAREHSHSSFAAWGNDSCISRTMDTIEAMENGYASDNQYRYWLAQYQYAAEV